MTDLTLYKQDGSQNGRVSFEAPKTKDFISFLDNLKVSDKVLVVVADYDENIARSARNLPEAKVITANAINVVDVLHADTLIMTQDALSKVEEAFN